MKKGAPIAFLLIFSLLILLAFTYSPEPGTQEVNQTATPNATATLTPVVTPTLSSEPKPGELDEQISRLLQVSQSTIDTAQTVVEYVGIVATIGLGLIVAVYTIGGVLASRTARAAGEMAKEARKAAEEARRVAEESERTVSAVDRAVKEAREAAKEAERMAQESERIVSETSAKARRDLDSLRISTGRIEATLDRFEVVAGRDPEARLRAAQRLTQSADPSAVSTLFYLLSTDEDPQVREAAAYGLGFQKARTALELLMECVQEDEDPYVRKQCAWALGEIAGPEDETATKRLEEVSKDDPDPEVREAAQEALRRIKGK
jgi:3-methyladenine DNA glycosylase AlkD